MLNFNDMSLTATNISSWKNKLCYMDKSFRRMRCRSENANCGRHSTRSAGSD